MARLLFAQRQVTYTKNFTMTASSSSPPARHRPLFPLPPATRLPGRGKCHVTGMWQQKEEKKENERHGNFQQASGDQNRANFIKRPKVKPRYLSRSDDPAQYNSVRLYSVHPENTTESRGPVPAPPSLILPACSRTGVGEAALLVEAVCALLEVSLLRPPPADKVPGSHPTCVKVHATMPSWA